MRHGFFVHLVCGILLLIGSAPPAFATESKPKLTLNSFLSRPKLVVVIVIDQFRSDYLTRFEKRFLPVGQKPGAWGGFRYLMAKGAYFPFAEYDLLQNMTCPGHATVLTGALPYAHHIATNDWYDSAAGKEIYCTDDSEMPLVGVDPSKRKGVSPKLLKTTTVGDELKNAGYPSRVVTVALKDRAAVMLGGHRADLAMWFDANTHRWISSHYYLPKDKLPEWVETLNRRIESRKQQKFSWQSNGSETGLSSSFDKGPFKREAILGTRESLATPAGVQLTTEAALAAVHALKLGTGTAPDLLGVSFSTHDFLGHQVGPNAREMEEITISEDQSLSDLLNGLEKAVPGGLKNVLVVLTADHGMAPSVPYLISGRLEAGAVDQDALVKRLNQELAKRFQIDGSAALVAAAVDFNFYLNQKTLTARKLDAREVENALRELLLKETATDIVFTRSDFLAGKWPAGEHGRQLRNTYVIGQSGDAILIPKPFYMANDNQATHMTGYTYDKSVPIILSGPNVAAGVYAKTAKVIDIAPTLSFLLGVLAPARNEGRVLDEAIGSK